MGEPFKIYKLRPETDAILSERGNQTALAQHGASPTHYSNILNGHVSDPFAMMDEVLFQPLLKAQKFDEAETFVDFFAAHLEFERMRAQKKKALNLDDCHRDKVTAGTDTILAMFEAMRDGKISSDEKQDLLEKIRVERSRLNKLETAILSEDTKQSAIENYNHEHTRDKTDEFKQKNARLIA